MDCDAGTSSDQQRVAIRGGSCDRFVADDAIGARAILDHDLLPQVPCEAGSEAAGQNVEGAARRKRHHQSYRLDGIVGCDAYARRGERRED